MNRIFPNSFLEIEVKADLIKKHVGKPIIYHHLENGESFLVSGILEDVSENQIFVDKLSLLCNDVYETAWINEKIADDAFWILQGSDFIKEAGENPILLKYIKLIYVPQEDISLEELQNVFLNNLKNSQFKKSKIN